MNIIESPLLPDLLEPRAGRDSGVNPTLVPDRRAARASSIGVELELVHRKSAIFTAPVVAESLLDAVGWRADKGLASCRLLEPACGEGAILVPAAVRLFESLRLAGSPLEFERLQDRILAYEIDAGTAEIARGRMASALRAIGVSLDLAELLVAHWIRNEDFVLARHDRSFTHVATNPPYLRWSRIPARLRKLYEAVLPRHVARGDLSLAFLWRALDVVETGGAVSFLFPDRWLRSKYGEKFRAELSGRVSLIGHVETHDLAVFSGSRKVETYPAISVFKVGGGPAAEPFFRRATSLADVANFCLDVGTRQYPLVTVDLGSPPSVIARSGGALLWDDDATRLVADLCDRYPVIRDAGMTIRCGTALGAASTFVLEDSRAVEADRLVPFVRTQDIKPSGEVVPSAWLANPWNCEGKLVDLRDFPKLLAKLSAERERLEARACVRSPAEWHRTIDKIRPDMVASPKIIIAGMADCARVGLSTGGCQPGNALYAIYPGAWPLPELARLLRAGALDLFAQVLAPRLRNGSKRFDGYVLGQVRLPPWGQLGSEQRAMLAAGSGATDNEIVAGIYDIKGDEPLEVLRALPRGVANAPSPRVCDSAM